MDNKFYYKTPALLLMMFAAHSTAAHAAEDTNADETNSTETPAVTNTQTSTEESVTTDNKYPTVQTIKADELNKLSTSPVGNSEETSQPDSTTSSIDNKTAAADIDTVETESNKTVTSEPAMTTSSINPESTQPEVTSTETTQPDVTQNTAVNSDVENTSPSSTKQISAEKIDNTTTVSSVPKSTTNSVATTQKTVVQSQAATTRTVGKVLKSNENSTSTQKAVSSMSVNDYIKYMNYTVPEYQESYSSNIPKYAYRNGVGAPEGIVAHETANNTSTIWGEINYMKNNYNSAFVHAFVDDTAIVETAPTDYLSWGAGPYANERFIQVELVRVQGKDRFAKSINNYADYIATNLLYYNLPVDSAEYDGNGTLWSHKAVSNFLGGTDHTDPYGWFAQNGYTFDEFTDLVKYKYNLKSGVTPSVNTTPATSPAPPAKSGTITTSAISKLAKLQSATTQVYSAVSDVTGKAAGNKYGQTYFVNKQAVLNGETYYLLEDNDKTKRGWVKSSQLTTASRGAETATTAQFKINSNITGLYSVPWGTSAQKVSNLKTNINQSFNPSKQVKVNSSLYYFGTINNLTGWINGKYLTPVPKITSVDLMGRTSKTGAIIYSNQLAATNTKLTDRQYYIPKQALHGSEKYYQLVDAANKSIGWVKSTAVSTKSHKKLAVPTTPFVINNTTSYLYELPAGSTTQRKTPLQSYNKLRFTITKAEQVGTALWYKGSIANTKLNGWINGKYLAAAQKAPAAVKSTVIKLKAPESLNTAVAKQVALINIQTNSGPKVGYISDGTTKYRIATASEIKAKMDTSKAINDDTLKYQFLALNESQGIPTETLNKLLVGKGILENQGAAFAKASKSLNINEIYLISHALLESGNGTSQLSNGMGFDASKGMAVNSTKKYYNMYGTKATDNNVLNGGIKYAYQNGWDTPEKAIIGGAQYVAKSYFDNNQITLHQMRWNPVNTATHQYATDIEWATKNAERIASFYKAIGLTGLKFLFHDYQK